MRSLVVALLVLVCGCATLGGVDDGTSLAGGRQSAGWLVRAARLPERGDGYLIPRTWAQRGLAFGTDELVALVVHAARRVAVEASGSLLYVADISPRRGGPTMWHRTHQNGRDVDLLFFALDEQGRPASAPDEMFPFDSNGRGMPLGRNQGVLTFDTARNWVLVKALLTAPGVDIQYLFISEGLKQLLLTHATALGEPLELIEKADEILHQPEDSAPHDDHLHMRIHCPVGDRAIGCYEQGPMRWLKKGYKYPIVRLIEDALWAPIRQFAMRPFCRFLARTVIASR